MKKLNQNVKKEIFEWIKSIIFVTLFGFLITTFIFQGTTVIGESMYPTLKNNDRLFINKAVFLTEKPKRGDIVILDAPYEKKTYIKRVIGLEGEKIEIKNGQIYINGNFFKEDYLDEDIITNSKDKSLWEIPKNHVFVIGDNRLNSSDSRDFGPIEIKKVRGKAFFRFFPFGEEFGVLH